MTESSGRWDANGSFEEAVEEQRQLAADWAGNLQDSALFHHVKLMALDNNALTLYERKALLNVVLDRLQGWHHD